MEVKDLSDKYLLFEIANTEKQIAHLIAHKKRLLDEVASRYDIYADLYRQGKITMDKGEGE